MQRNAKLDEWIKSKPSLVLMLLPLDMQGKQWRDRIRVNALRLGIRICYINDKGAYYMVRMN